MTDEKHVLLSKGIWGGLVALVVPLLQALGVIDGSTAAELMNVAPDILLNAVIAAAAVIGLYGRFSATSRLKLKR